MHEELSVDKYHSYLAQLQKEALFMGGRKISGTLEHPYPPKPLLGLPEWPEVPETPFTFIFH